MDCSPPGSSIHGTLQARILEWVAVSFFRRSSWRGDQTCVPCVGRRVLYPEPPGKPIWRRKLNLPKFCHAEIISLTAWLCLRRSAILPTWDQLYVHSGLFFFNIRTMPSVLSRYRLLNGCRGVPWVYGPWFYFCGWGLGSQSQRGYQLAPVGADGLFLSVFSTILGLALIATFPF